MFKLVYAIVQEIVKLEGTIEGFVLLKMHKFTFLSNTVLND